MVTVPPLAVVYTIRLVDMMVLPFFTETIKSGWFDQSFAWSNHPYTTGSQLLADSQRVLLTISPLSLDYSNHEGLHISLGCVIVTIRERVDLPHHIHHDGGPEYLSGP